MTSHQYDDPPPPTKVEREKIDWTAFGVLVVFCGVSIVVGLVILFAKAGK